MGSATVYNLAARGRKVLALEQHNIPHDLGSSHGINRIIRLAYAEDPRYIPMLRRAYRLWRDLGKKAGEKLLFITGGIDAGAEDSWVRGSLKSCSEHRLKYEMLTSTELHKKFPGFCLPKEMVAVYQPQGGFVLSERSIIAYFFLALDLGAEIHAREKVLDWKVQRGMVTVRTDRRSYRAARLVITAGPWSADAINQLKGIVRPERQVLDTSQTPMDPRLL
jgi:sarcosine oxidase